MKVIFFPPDINFTYSVGMFQVSMTITSFIKSRRNNCGKKIDTKSLFYCNFSIVFFFS